MLTAKPVLSLEYCECNTMVMGETILEVTHNILEK